MGILKYVSIKEKIQVQWQILTPQYKYDTEVLAMELSTYVGKIEGLINVLLNIQHN